MARVAVTVQSVPSFGAGLALATAAAMDATNDHEFVNDGKTWLGVLNTDSSSHVVSVVGVASRKTFNQVPTMPQTVPAITGAIPGLAIWGPLDPEAFNQSTGKVNVDLTVSTGMYVFAFSVVDIKGY